MKLKNYKDFLIEENSVPNSFKELLEGKGFELINGYWNFSGKSVRFSRSEKEILIKNQKLNVKFGEISGDFTFCGSGDEEFLKLKSLEGLPLKVKGEYCISYNQIKSLEGIGEFISLDASYNHLTSLKGLPKKIKGYLDVSYNHIKSLEEGPEEVRLLDVSNNKLKDLEGCPIVSHNLYLNENLLTTFKGVKLINRTILSSYSGNDIKVEEVKFIRHRIKNKQSEVKDYNLELINFVVKELGSEKLKNLNFDQSIINGYDKEIQNLFKMSKKIGKFGI